MLEKVAEADLRARLKRLEDFYLPFDHLNLRGAGPDKVDPLMSRPLFPPDGKRRLVFTPKGLYQESMGSGEDAVRDLQKVVTCPRPQYMYPEGEGGIAPIILPQHDGRDRERLVVNAIGGQERSVRESHRHFIRKAVKEAYDAGWKAAWTAAYEGGAIKPEYVAPVPTEGPEPDEYES